MPTTRVGNFTTLVGIFATRLLVKITRVGISAPLGAEEEDIHAANILFF